MSLSSIILTEIQSSTAVQQSRTEGAADSGRTGFNSHGRSVVKLRHFAAARAAAWRPTMYLLWEIVIGILAGYLAGQIVKGRGMGVLVDLIVGIIGALIGGRIFMSFGIGFPLIGQLVVATIGAVILLLLIRVIKRA